MRTSARATATPPFLAMEIARDAGRLVAEGRSVARFDVGQPFVGAPESALAAAERAMQAEALGYTDALGSAALRQAIAADYGRRYGLDLDPARVIVTTGASGAFVLAFLALFDPGERVAMASPGYPPYRHILSTLGLEAAIAEADAEDRFQLTAAHVQRLAAERGVAGAIAASPANPTGTMLEPAALAALAEACRSVGAAFVSDEIYHGLSYGPPAMSALSVDPDVIVVSSFSKYWAMTGWRVGWIVAPEALVKPIERLAQNLFISPPAVAQAAALGALEAQAECEARRALYAESRALLLDTLPRLGFARVAPADGAFYVLADISAHSDDSLEFCRRALFEAGVAMTPGVDFCERRGHRWVRLAYPQPPHLVSEGLERLARWRGVSA